MQLISSYSFLRLLIFGNAVESRGPKLSMYVLNLFWF